MPSVSVPRKTMEWRSTRLHHWPTSKATVAALASVPKFCHADYLIRLRTARRRAEEPRISLSGGKSLSTRRQMIWKCGKMSWRLLTQGADVGRYELKDENKKESCFAGIAGLVSLFAESDLGCGKLPRLNCATGPAGPTCLAGTALPGELLRLYVMFCIRY